MMFMCMTDRQDGSPILTTTIYHKGQQQQQHQAPQMKSRSVSPFDFERVKKVLLLNINEQEHKGRTSIIRKAKAEGNMVDNSDENNTINEIPKSLMTNIEALRYWEYLKANFKTKLYPFYPQEDDLTSVQSVSIEW